MPEFIEILKEIKSRNDSGIFDFSDKVESWGESLFSLKSQGYILFNDSTPERVQISPLGREYLNNAMKEDKPKQSIHIANSGSGNVSVGNIAQENESRIASASNNPPENAISIVSIAKWIAGISTIVGSIYSVIKFFNS